MSSPEGPENDPARTRDTPSADPQAPLRILYLEPSAVDAARVAELLARAGIEAELERVTDLDAFAAALGQHEHALILSDLAVTGGVIFEALALARKLQPRVPYIVVSGTPGEELAVEALKRGATDYVLKQRLERLVPVLQRALTADEDETESRFRQLADSMPQLVWTAQPDGTVDYYNGRVVEFLGFTRRPDGAWMWKPVLHPDDLEPSARAWTHAVATGERYEIEHRVKRADGTYHWYLSRGVPARDAAGRIVKWYGTATDIDAQKSAEAALRDADRRKSEFLAVLSHELRNPLAPIRNSIYVLDRAPPESPQARKAHEVIDRQVNHMIRLVDDLLDVTRISRGKVRLQRAHADVCEIVQRTAEDHRSLFAKRGVALEVVDCHTQLVIDGDTTRISQVIGNLLVNAVKFTPRGGRVVLSVAAEDGTAAIRVRDNGTGIAADVLERLFEPFTQADQTLDRSKGGLGLGLALVKGLVEMHGGSVSAQSGGTGKGAEITVRLPLVAAPLDSVRRDDRGAPRDDHPT